MVRAWGPCQAQHHGDPAAGSCLLGKLGHHSSPCPTRPDGVAAPQGGGCSTGPCTSLHTLVHPCASLCTLAYLSPSLHTLVHPCTSLLILACPFSSLHTLVHLCISLYIFAHPCASLHTLVHPCASCSTPVARLLHPSTIPFRPGWVGSMMQKASVFCYEYLFFSLYFFFGQTKTFLQGMTVTDYICQGFYQAIERAGDFWKPNK